MKKFLLACMLLAVLVAGGTYLVLYTPFAPFSHLEEEPDYFMTVRDKEIYRIEGETEEVFEIKGVDLGAGRPGAFATEFAIDYDTYYK